MQKRLFACLSIGGKIEVSFQGQKIGPRTNVRPGFGYTFGPERGKLPRRSGSQRANYLAAHCLLITVLLL